MLALPSFIVLVVFVYLRPQEYFEALKSVPFLHLSCALAMFGLLVDLRLGLLRLRPWPRGCWPGRG